MMRHIIFVLITLMSLTSIAIAGPSIPNIQPFSNRPPLPGYQQKPQQKSQLTDAQIRETLQNNIKKSKKHSNLIIPLVEFNSKLNNAGVLSMDFVKDPLNTLYIFTDPKCPLSAKAFQQIVGQQVIFEANRINVKWLPIVQNGDSALYQKAVNLFTNDPKYQDTTPNQARELIRFNTELFATSFDKIATPLVFWQTTNGIDVLLGYPKPKNNNSFLSIVGQKKEFLDWLIVLAK